MNKRTFKRILGFLLVFVLVLATISACAPAATEAPRDEAPAEGQAPAESGSSDPEIIDSSSYKIPAKGLKFGIIAHDRAIEWVNYGVMNFEYACKRLGIEPVIIDAQNNMEKVISGMEDLLAKQVNAVIVYSFSPDVDARACKMARDAGIPIIMENARVDESLDCDSNTAFGYVEVGTEVANFIEKNWPGAKVVYIMGQPGMNITELYEEALNTAEGRGALTVVDKQPTNWTSEEAMNAMQNVLQSGREFDVIFSNNEQITKGVLAALEDANAKGKYPIVTTGGSPLGEEMVRSGDIDCTIDIPVSYQAMTSVKLAYAKLNGIEVEKFPQFPMIPITKDNIDTLIPWPPDEKTVEAIGGLLP